MTTTEKETQLETSGKDVEIRQEPTTSTHDKDGNLEKKRIGKAVFIGFGVGVMFMLAAKFVSTVIS